MHNLIDKLHKVHDRVHTAAIQAGRSPNMVQLLAVSKTQPAEAIVKAYDAGQRAFGENYLQEALEKQSQLADFLISPSDPIEWHFIGPIQSNKTRDIAEHFDWVHSIDRLKLATRLNDQRGDDQPALNICLQINVDEEASKQGIAFSDLDTLYEIAEAVARLPRLQLRGLMAIPKARPDRTEQQIAFAKVRQRLDGIKERLQQDNIDTHQLDTLSMGMSGDLEAAIAEGATIVRVGTDIFGPRQR